MAAKLGTFSDLSQLGLLRAGLEVLHTKVLSAESSFENAPDPTKDPQSSPSEKKNKIRYRNFFKKISLEPDQIKVHPPSILAACQNELQSLTLDELLKIRLLQVDLGSVPESLEPAHRFISALEANIFTKFVDLCIARTTAPRSFDVLPLLFSTGNARKGGSLLLQEKQSLGKDLVRLLGFLECLARGVLPDKDSLRGAGATANGIWRLVLRVPRTLHSLLDRDQSSQSSARRGRAAASKGVDEPAATSTTSVKLAPDPPEGDPTTRDSKFRRARSQSVEAVKRTLSLSGTRLLDVFFRPGFFTLSASRPDNEPVYLLQSTDWTSCQTLSGVRNHSTSGLGLGALPMGGVAVGGSSELRPSSYPPRAAPRIEIWRLQPEAPLDNFLRPIDVTSAIRNELKGTLIARKEQRRASDEAHQESCSSADLMAKLASVEYSPVVTVTGENAETLVVSQKEEGVGSLDVRKKRLNFVVVQKIHISTSKNVAAKQSEIGGSRPLKNKEVFAKKTNRVKRQSPNEIINDTNCKNNNEFKNQCQVSSPHKRKSFTLDTRSRPGVPSPLINGSGKAIARYIEHLQTANQIRQYRFDGGGYTNVCTPAPPIVVRKDRESSAFLGPLNRFKTPNAGATSGNGVRLTDRVYSQKGANSRPQYYRAEDLYPLAAKDPSRCLPKGTFSPHQFTSSARRRYCPSRCRATQQQMSGPPRSPMNFKV